MSNSQKSAWVEDEFEGEDVISKRQRAARLKMDKVSCV